MIYEEIFREFQREKVRYLIVGGIALNLLGGLRTTADLDILVEMTNPNLLKIIKILKKKGYRAKQPVDPMQFVDRETREDWIKNKHMKAFNFYKNDELKEVDLIIDSPVTFEGAKKRIKRIRVDDLSLPVISIDDLIRMKRSAGRDVDQWDVKELKKIKKLRGRS